MLLSLPTTHRSVDATRLCYPRLLPALAFVAAAAAACSASTSISCVFNCDRSRTSCGVKLAAPRDTPCPPAMAPSLPPNLHTHSEPCHPTPLRQCSHGYNDNSACDLPGLGASCCPHLLHGPHEVGPTQRSQWLAGCLAVCCAATHSKHWPCMSLVLVYTVPNRPKRRSLAKLLHRMQHTHTHTHTHTHQLNKP